MAEHTELREFLRSRRARLTPPDVGLPWNMDGRRVAGLRREEIAVLAGVSVDYYTRLEQGRAHNVSDQVLAAVAAALRLDGLERQHLFDLVRADAGRPDRTAAAPPGRSAPARPRRTDQLLLRDHRPCASLPTARFGHPAHLRVDRGPPGTRGSTPKIWRESCSEAVTA
ncbi:helix-turn-helix domain-containing protein [Streptomyces sp. NPDC048231]|uniref:helix-turn-helix domain-containing protein n=1 Tax=Streptomyces sp. NPDC048231 TaxID=3365519 RepID=UPI0037224208